MQAATEERRQRQTSERERANNQEGPTKAVQNEPEVGEVAGSLLRRALALLLLLLLPPLALVKFGDFERARLAKTYNQTGESGEEEKNAQKRTAVRDCTCELSRSTVFFLTVNEGSSGCEAPQEHCGKVSGDGVRKQGIEK